MGAGGGRHGRVVAAAAVGPAALAGLEGALSRRWQLLRRGRPWPALLRRLVLGHVTHGCVWAERLCMPSVSGLEYKNVLALHRCGIWL